MSAVLSSIALVSCLVGWAQGQGVEMPQPFPKAKERFEKGELMEDRLVVADPVPQGKYPWIVALVHTKDPNNFRAQFCGGALLFPNIVVTAAHCVDQVTDKQQVSILHSVVDLEGQVPPRVALEAIHTHPTFSRTDKIGDVALLILKVPVVQKAGRIGFASAAEYAESYREGAVPLVVAGWGRRTFGGLKAPKLMESPIRLLPDSRCTAKLAYDKAFLSDDMICAGVWNLGANVCGGDSGGPLFQMVGSSAAVFGVVSWGDGCNKPNKFGVYARLLTYAPWLEEIIAKNLLPSEQSVTSALRRDRQK